MPRFRQKTPELPLISDVGEHLIIRTLEASPIDPEQVILVGSAALTLYGVDLPRVDPNKDRPEDIDLATSPIYISEVYMKGGFHEKDELTKQMIIRQAQCASGFLPIELICRYRNYRGGGPAGYTQRFAKFWAANSQDIPGSRFHIATTAVIAAELENRAGSFRTILDQKAAQDLASLRSFIEDKQ